jgi:hypothetical protein
VRGIEGVACTECEHMPWHAVVAHGRPHLMCMLVTERLKFGSIPVVCSQGRQIQPLHNACDRHLPSLAVCAAGHPTGSPVQGVQ